MNFFKKPLIALVVLACLSGCALTGGKTAYTIEPIKVGSGEVVCCKVTINNSKDYDRLKFNLEKKPDGTIKVSLDESGVSASDPAAIAAANQSKLIDAVAAIVPKIGSK